MGAGVTLRLIQHGAGPARVVVCGWHTAPEYLHDVPPDAVLAVDVSGAYTSPTPLSTVLDWLHRSIPGEPWVPRALVLLGWSAGCQAIRAHLKAGARPQVVVALDGTSGSVPADDAAHVAPWRELAERARAGGCLALLSHTGMTYTERLPPAQRYAATVTILRAATGWALDDDGPIEAPVERVEGDLHVLSCRSAAGGAPDAAAHVAQVTTLLPRLLRGHVVPWLARRFPPDGSGGEMPLPVVNGGPPATTPPLSLGERCVRLSQSEAATVRESPDGSNTSARIREYLAPCARRATGAYLGLVAANWCAAGACWVQREALLPGEHGAHGYRASGAELVDDATEVGTWRPVTVVRDGGWTPARGDLAIYHRGLPGSWERHVARVVEWRSDGTYRTIGANEANRWRETERRLDDRDLLGFIAYPRDAIDELVARGDLARDEDS